MLLNILGKRPDAFHELETVMHPVRVFDRISFVRASHGEIPIVLGGAVAGGAMPRGDHGMRVLERIDQSVRAVEELLAERVPAAAR